MAQGLPELKDLATPVGNILVYPKRVLIALLESAFSEPHLYTDVDENPFLLKKTPDGEVAEDSRIVIADNYTDELTKVGPRPMIIVVRGDTGFQNLSIGGQLNTFSQAPGREEYADMTESSLNANCIARRSAEAETLGSVVFEFLRIFKKEIRNKSHVFRWSDPRAGSTIVIKQDAQSDLFLVPISMVVQEPMKWVVKRPTKPYWLRLKVFLKNHENEPILET